jgi:D-beta-D-heptose 7-phosphate kinase/D-beta-D-heptose 1-phosphate adenosyltransferase
MLALGMSVGLPVESAAWLANFAAGIVIGKVGTAGISIGELTRELSPLAPLPDAAAAKRALSKSELLERLRWWRLSNKKIVFTNGCFDILHEGHLTFLQEAAALGDVLIVGINSDDSVARLKGPGRPVVPQRSRAAVLSALGCVSCVTIFDADTPEGLIEIIQPDILVKGGDYKVEDIVGRDIVEARNGRVITIPLVPVISTTILVERLLANFVSTSEGGLH